MGVIGGRGEDALMTDVDVATEIPSHNLPGVPYADLPQPTGLGKIVGPGVVLLAGSIGSGEYILWPFIASQTGMTLVWLAVLGILTQYFLNTEIERYTLATGETSVTGFTRLWKPWGALFIVFTLVPWAWPGWATGASTVTTYIFGWSDGAVVPLTIALLILIGIVLTASPVVYKTVEKVQMAFVLAIVVFIVIALFAAVTGDAIVAMAEGFVRIDRIPDGVSTVGFTSLLGALAFAGAGGTLNLTTSNWIRDKGLGMGARIPRITSPFTGEEEAAVTTGYFFRRDEDNMRRWNRWWDISRQEQALTFLTIGGVSILLFMLLTRATLGGVSDVGEGFEFIRSIGDQLGATVGSWLGTFYWAAGFAALFSTNLAVLDMVGRVTADILKVGVLRDNETWTENRVYFAVIWLEIAFGCGILLSGLNQPLVLVVISSALNGGVMFIYSFLLIQLNRGTLPRALKMENHRLGWMIWAVLFYGFFTLITLWNEVPKLFGG
jgi:Mn2+/Fe2+ NRAMP family transporter